MVSISIVYPTCSRAGLTLKSEAKTTHPIAGLETVGSLMARLNREICILMGQSYIVLFTLPFSQYVYNYYPPVPMVRRHESRLRYNPSDCAGLLTSFRRHHYRAWLPSCFFPKHRTLWTRFESIMHLIFVNAGFLERVNA